MLVLENAKRRSRSVALDGAICSGGWHSREWGDLCFFGIFFVEVCYVERHCSFFELNLRRLHGELLQIFAFFTWIGC